MVGAQAAEAGGFVIPDADVWPIREGQIVTATYSQGRDE